MRKGASLLEYTVLIAIITVAVIGSIGQVGTWVTGKWATLITTLNANAVTQ